MTDSRATLMRCFELTFPGLAPEEIPRASADTTEGWDSLRSLTLHALLEEDLGIRIPLEALPELRSFASIAGYLEAHGHGG